MAATATEAFSTETSVLGTEQVCPVGFDLSCSTCRVSFIPADNILYQIAKNRHGELSTPAAVRLDGTRRFTGKDAISKNNGFPDVMKVIGRSMSDIQSAPELHQWVMKEENSNRLIVSFPDSDERFTPIEVLAMLITDLKITAERALGVTVVECCIAVPSYFTQSQRTAVCQAAEIAGLSQVSLLNSTTATAIYHGFNRRLILQQDKYHDIVFVDVGNAMLQISIVRLGKNSVKVLSYLNDSSTSERNFLDALASHFKKAEYSSGSTRSDPGMFKTKYIKGRAPANEYGDIEITESMFSEACGPLLNRLADLFEKALSRAEEEIKESDLVVNGVVLTGPGVQMCALRKYLEDYFKQEPFADAKFADESVAKGCAIKCAIHSVAFKNRTEAPRHKDLKKGLLKWKVDDNVVLSVQEQMIAVPVAEAMQTRFELGVDEISAAYENERKMASREKLRVMISDMLKIKEFAKKDEEQMLNELMECLDHDDFESDEKYSHVNLVDKRILARKNENEKADSMAKNLSRKLKYYDALVSSQDAKYRTVKKESRDEFKDLIKQTRGWLLNQTKMLSNLSKNDDPISFIPNVNIKIDLLEQNWKEAQMEREPDIEKVTYDMTLDSYMNMIDDFRRRLVKGRENAMIKTCYLLPHQVEVKNIPMKWFQAKLVGRDDDWTTVHIKIHNVYTMAFSNKEEQVYEMGPAPLEDKDLVDPKIPGAFLLGFNCDYISMINPTSSTYDNEVVLAKIRELKVGEGPWFDAIHVLSNHGCNPDHHKGCPLCSAPYAVRLAIMTINFMLNEPTRIIAVCEAVFGGCLSFTDVLIQCIWHWKDLSKVLRTWARDNTQIVVDEWLANLTNAHNVDEVARLLYLILNTLAPGKLVLDTSEDGPSSGPSRSSGDDDGDNDRKGKKEAQLLPRTPGSNDGANKGQPESVVGPGKTLLQIFNVIPRCIELNDIKGILVHEDRGTHVIYSQRDTPGFWLSGPDLAISSEAGSFLEIIPTTTKTINSDDICMRLDDGFSCYNKAMSKIMKYGGGEVDVAYAVLTGAVELNVEIKLQLPPTGRTYSISGLVWVNQGIGSSMLRVDRADYVSMYEQPIRSRAPGLGLLDLVRSMPKILPLSRSVFAVKLGDLIVFHGRLSIGVGDQSVILYDVIQIPSNVCMIKKIETPWVQKGTLPMMLVDLASLPDTVQNGWEFGCGNQDSYLQKTEGLD